MRPKCEKCGRDLPPDSPDAVICSYECTFCREHELAACPNCKGELVRRPTRLLPAPVVEEVVAGPPGLQILASGYVFNRDDGSQARLTELVRAEILNEDEVYFVLVGPENSLLIPQATPGTEALLAHLQKLPGFQHGRFLEALEGQGRFICWERPVAP